MRILSFYFHRDRRGRRGLGQRGGTCEELFEGDAAVFVDVEDGDDSLDEGVLVELRDIEYLFGVEVAGRVGVDLEETGVEFLDLFGGEFFGKLGGVDDTHRSCQVELIIYYIVGYVLKREKCINRI